MQVQFAAEKMIESLLESMQGPLGLLCLFNWVYLDLVTSIGIWLPVLCIDYYVSAMVLQICFMIFTHLSDVHGHLARQSENLFIPTFQTNLVKTFLIYRGPFSWIRIYNFNN